MAREIARNHGVLIVSNHSYHYDSYVLIEAGLRGGWLAHIMTAWQVFMLYKRWGQLMLQRHGCFSINREGNDAQAFRFAVNVLTTGPHPLVIYPEGDIYHSNDRVMPFREGAAAIGLMAQRKQARPVVVIPCAMKCFYTVDPTPELVQMMNSLEAQIRWRPRPDLPLLERIYRFGNGFLALKEVEYLGQARSGAVRERLLYLADAILNQVQQRQGVPSKGGDIGARIRYLRGHLIRQFDKFHESRRDRTRPADAREQLARLHEEMEDLFFVTQLSSYHGDYSAQKPTIERLAETIDKFEEDLFALQAPTPRGRRRAVVRFGTPLPLLATTQSAAELTVSFERSVQQLLDEITSEHERGTLG